MHLPTRSSTLLALVVAALAAAPVAGQRRTIIVDANNGPGAQFRAIQPAIDAARDGDLIVVRRGSYRGFDVRKGVSIVAATGVVMQTGRGAIVAVGLPAGRDLVLRGFASSPVGDSAISVVSCLGRVWIDRCTVRVPRAGLVPPAVSVNRSRQVSVSESRIVGGLLVSRSTVAVHDCRIEGRHAFSSIRHKLQGAAGINVAGTSRLILARSVVHGGNGLATPLLRAGPAVRTNLADVTITGDATSELRAGGVAPTPVSAIEVWNGTLQRDPTVRLLPHANAPAIAGNARLVTERLPSLLGRAAGPGGRIDLEIFAPFGAATFLFVSSPADATAPTPFGDIWLDLQGPLLLASVGVTGRDERMRTSVTVPASVPRGLPLVWQALVSMSGRNRMSNPFGHGLD